MFIRYAEGEFLFFGDLESREEGYGEIWKAAAASWRRGRLKGIFVSRLVLDVADADTDCSARTPVS